MTVERENEVENKKKTIIFLKIALSL